MDSSDLPVVQHLLTASEPAYTSLSLNDFGEFVDISDKKLLQLKGFELTPSCIDHVKKTDIFESTPTWRVRSAEFIEFNKNAFQ